MAASVQAFKAVGARSVGGMIAVQPGIAKRMAIGRGLEASRKITSDSQGSDANKGEDTTASEREFLLLRAQSGESEALNALFECCHSKLYQRALAILRRPEDAEDAVQEAMLAAFKHLGRFQGRADFLTWTTRIVINAALQQIRKTRARPTVACGHGDDDLNAALPTECFIDPQPTPEEHLRRVEQSEIVTDGMRKLPIEMRQTLQFCYYEDCSAKDTASALGLPVSTVKARLHRARQKLLVCVNMKTRFPGKETARKQKFHLRPSSPEIVRAA